MKGKKIKQINNLEIRYTELYRYAVWTKGKYGKCLEDRMTLEQAEEFCRNTKDFLKESVIDYYDEGCKKWSELFSKMKSK